jgi:hypothetical protein
MIVNCEYGELRHSRGTRDWAAFSWAVQSPQ